MTMKSVYIVYITNCFLWTMSDNKTYRIVSYHGGSSAGSYLADPTSPIPSHCAVIILFQSVAVHQLP